jgi:two-component system chemotaxis response regulator CheB
VPIVAIGSSADGVAALRELVSALPATLPAAVIIVQHLSPTRRSRLAWLLGRATDLRVKEAEDGETLLVGTVYVARPGLHLSVADGCVRLASGPKVQFSRPSIDVLMTSVAAVCGARSVGVVLGGANADGALGLAAIRKAGGATIVQNPAEMRYPQLPRAALALADHPVLSLKEIPAEIRRLADALAKDHGERRQRASGASTT